MANWYTTLGVEANASVKEIKEAYRRLAKTCHPDKVAGKEALFLLIQEAYEVLSDPVRRREYDNASATPSSRPKSPKAVRFKLMPHPSQYNYYDYLNTLLQLHGDNCLIPGQQITESCGLEEKLDYIANVLFSEELRLDCRSIPLSAEQQAQKQIVSSNLEKIRACRYVLCRDYDKKKLYDLSLGVESSAELQEIARLLGGIPKLKHYIEISPNMDSAPSVFILYQAQLLTPANFNRLAQGRENQFNWAECITILSDSGLLTQKRFNALTKDVRAGSISFALYNFKNLDLLTERYVDTLLAAGKNISTVSYALQEVHTLGLLNELNFQMVINTLYRSEVWRVLMHVSIMHYVTKDHSEALHWSGPSQVQDLCHQLDKMVAHGLYLMNCSPSEGIRTMMLALDLKTALKQFVEQTPQQQHLNQERFKRTFFTKLHSADEHMAVHRQQWKVILANILIALTGIGLLALGVNAVRHRSCFFALTKRQQCIKAIEQEMERPFAPT